MAGHIIAFAHLDHAVRLMEGDGVPVKRDSVGQAFVGWAHNNGAVMVLIKARPA